MLPTVAGTDLGIPEEPGEYAHDGASYIVSSAHVDAWREDPASAFTTILLTRVGDDSMRYAVGAPVEA